MKELYPQFNSMLKAGTTLSPVMRKRMQTMNRSQLIPILRSLSNRGGSKIDPRGQEFTRLMADQYMPLEAQSENQINQFDMGEISKLRQLMAGMVG